MAATGDRAETEIPGPRSREIGSASRAPSRARCGDVPDRRCLGARRDADRRRRQHLHRLRRRRRLPQRRSRPSRRASRRRTSSSTASPTPTSRSSRTSRTSRSPSGWPSARRSPGPVKAAFFNAGTEAVENAVKFARAYTGRPAVIAFEGAFHGRTMLSLTLTSKVHPYKAGLGPFAPEVYRVPFPNAYRGVTTDDALARARARVQRPLSPPRPSRRSSSSRCRARAASSSRRPSSCRACAVLCDTPRDRPRRRRGADRLRPHRPLLRRSSTSASSPT